MEHKQKLLAALSLCRKAGKLVKGFDAVQESVFSGKAALVLLAQDVSEGTEKRMRRACQDFVDCVGMPLTQLELCCLTYKKVGVYSILDENLANLCRQYITDEKEETE